MFLLINNTNIVFSMEWLGNRHAQASQRRKKLEEERTLRFSHQVFHRKQVNASHNRYKQMLANSKRRQGNLRVELELLQMGWLTEYALSIHDCLYNTDQDALKKLLTSRGFIERPQEKSSCQSWIKTTEMPNDRDSLKSLFFIKLLENYDSTEDLEKIVAYLCKDCSFLAIIEQNVQSL